MSSAEFYARSDLDTAKRIGGGLWAVAGAMTVAMLFLSPPDRALGWAVVAALAVGCAASALRLLRRPGAVTPNELYVSSLIAPVAIAGVVWAGGPGSPYDELFLLSCVYTGAVHPWRRVLPYLAWFVAAACAPLVYDGWTSTLAVQVFGHLIIWVPLTFLAMAYTARVRRQRLALTAESGRARAQARLDALTGLRNRRAFDEELAVEVRSARASGRALSVVVGDLDGFKRINDTYGHLAGDACLRAVGHAIGAAVRGDDRSYRWGGDEFAVVLPGSDADSAEVVSGRLAEAVQRSCAAPDGEALRLQCGTSELADRMDVGELMAMADIALMERKAQAPFKA